MSTFYYIPDADSILHHGVKGQKWGERQYQNKDGSWTEKGKLRRRLERASVQRKINKIDKYRQKQSKWATKARTLRKKTNKRTLRGDLYGDIANMYLNKDFKAVRKYKTKFENYLNKYGYKDLPLSDLDSKYLKMNMYDSLWYS